MAEPRITLLSARSNLPLGSYLLYTAPVVKALRYCHECMVSVKGPCQYKECPVRAIQQQPEPVAWRYRLKARDDYPAGPWYVSDRELEMTPGQEIEPLYTAPPALQQQEVPREPVARYEAVGTFMEDGGRWLKMDAIYANDADAVTLYRAASPSTTQQQEAGGGWIAVTEGLPELGTECLVYGPHWFSETPCIRMDCWDEQREALVSFSSLSTPVGAGWCDSAFEEVTHWMPLPAAPSTPESAEKDDAGGGKEVDRG